MSPCSASTSAHCASCATFLRRTRDRKCIPVRRFFFPFLQLRRVDRRCRTMPREIKKTTRNHNNPFAAFGMHPILAIDSVSRKTNISGRPHVTQWHQPDIRRDFLLLTNDGDRGDSPPGPIIRGTAAPFEDLPSPAIEAQNRSPARSNPAARRTISSAAELPKNIRGASLQPATCRSPLLSPFSRLLSRAAPPNAHFHYPPPNAHREDQWSKK